VARLAASSLSVRVGFETRDPLAPAAASVFLGFGFGCEPGRDLDLDLVFLAIEA
jgi:hypothetical protein